MNRIKRNYKSCEVNFREDKCGCVSIHLKIKDFSLVHCFSEFEITITKRSYVDVVSDYMISEMDKELNISDLDRLNEKIWNKNQ